MKVKSAELIAVTGTKSQYPAELGCDIVLAGRSNVGKSSLINRMINRKGLARTSSSPGKTRTINFYAVDDSFYFVDLPGYGYAKVSKGERQAFARMIDSYFDCGRKMVCWQIVDLRHPPTVLDMQMTEYLRGRNIPFLVVATKADKLSKNQIFKNSAVIKRELNLDNEEIVVFSSQSGVGKDILNKKIEGIL